MPIVIRHLADSSLAGTTTTVEGQRARLGRGADCDVVFAAEQDAAVSTQHAELTCDDQGVVTITDLGSTNGVWLDGQRIDTPRTVGTSEVRLGEQGPAFALGPAASEVPATMQMAAVAQRRPVGPQTMQTAIASATAQERKRSRGIMLVMVLIFGIAIAATAAIAMRAASDNKDLRDQLGAQSEQRAAERDELEQRIADLGDKLGNEAAEVARLQLALRQRDRDLAEIRADDEMDDARRAELVAEYRREIDGLRADLVAAESAAEAVVASAVDAWPSVLDRHQHSLFLCVATDPKTRQVAIGTAFAIGDDVLVTNAHVVQSMARLPVRFVVQNQTGAAVVVEAMAAHPLFNGASSPDIGLVRIEPSSLGEPVTPWQLADDPTVHALRIGAQVGTAGFPGELQSRYLSLVDRADRRFTGVLATFKTGWIGRLTTYAGEWRGPDKAVQIQHSASLSGGTSGSPMFLDDGTVVGVTNASLDAHLNGDQSDRLLSAAEIGFAIRTDQIRAFLNDDPFTKHRVRVAGNSRN